MYYYRLQYFSIYITFRDITPSPNVTSHQMHLLAQLTRSCCRASTISRDSHQNIRLHTGARVIVVLGYLFTCDMIKLIDT